MGIWDSIKKGVESLAGEADADLLANGVLARGEVTAVIPEGTTIQVSNQLVKRRCTVGLTVYMDDQKPYQAQVGNAVPAEHLPLLYPGSRLHARLGNGENDIVVDWAKGAAKAA